jgi:hypothetical protein
MFIESLTYATDGEEYDYGTAYASLHPVRARSGSGAGILLFVPHPTVATAWRRGRHFDDEVVAFAWSVRSPRC